MKRFKNILCVVDLETNNKAALRHAVRLAENNQAGLTVIDVVEKVAAEVGMPEGGPISAELQDALLKEHEERLNELVEPYRKKVKINTRMLVGSTFLEVIREVLRGGHDLVIKTPEPTEWLDWLYGSDDMHLLRKCPCPVWLIKHDISEAFRRILAAVDVDDLSTEEEREAKNKMNQQIAEMAGSLALSEYAELHVVHAWQAIGESAMHGPFMMQSDEDISAYVSQVKQHHKQAFDEFMDELRDRLGKDAVDYLKPRAHLIKGSARKEIPNLAKQLEVDLVVMGTVARTGIPGFFMGNTAETILSQLQCSVLAIKPEGFITPVTLED